MPRVSALRRPVAVLALVCVASLAARVAWLPDPCHVPCRSASDHVLVFDEDYYVNAARVIAGVHPPSGVPYAHSPLGDDPNAEHPQLAKLAVAGAVVMSVLGGGVAFAFWSTAGSGTGTGSTSAGASSLTVTQTSAPTDLAPGVAAEPISGTVMILVVVALAWPLVRLLREVIRAKRLGPEVVALERELGP